VPQRCDERTPDAIHPTRPIRIRGEQIAFQNARNIRRAGCWSHARRKFVDAEKADPRIAREAVALMRSLFAVEKQAKDVSAAQRLQLRQQQSAPVLAELREKL